MADSAQREKVILLFDSYHEGSRKLHHSFQLAGRKYPVVVIEENGFLPNGVESVFGYFMGDFSRAPNCLGRPRYFNEIRVPDYWEISATNFSGKVSDLFRERARIFYTNPAHKRHVKAVDWLDEKAVVRYTDHYDRFGNIFARTTMTPEGKPMMRSYFSPEGQEIIVENYVTRDLILNQEGAVRIFKNRTELVLYFLKERGYEHHALYMNSLSTPFFVSCASSENGGADVLFWQEGIKDQIPGNMQMILEGKAPRVGRIYVQKPADWQKLTDLGADRELVKKKGFIYPFIRENQHRPSVLICTNSDQIRHCEEIAAALPGVQFHIAAITEMSSKLMSMGKYENVHLYPCIRTERGEALFSKCDFYLDINEGNEILSALQKAFLHNMLILAYSGTSHNPDFTQPNCIYDQENWQELAKQVEVLAADGAALEEKLKEQRAYALTETPESFLRIV